MWTGIQMWKEFEYFVGFGLFSLSLKEYKRVLELYVYIYIYVYIHIYTYIYIYISIFKVFLKWWVQLSMVKFSIYY